MRVEAPGLEGRTVQFAVEQQRDGQWQPLATVTAKVKDGIAVAQVSIVRPRRRAGGPQAAQAPGRPASGAAALSRNLEGVAVLSIAEFTGIPVADDRRAHPRNDLQIEQGAQIVVRWRVTDATQVKISVQEGDDDPVEMEPIAASELTTTLTPKADCRYRLVAMAEGEEDVISTDEVVVHLNTPGSTVSPTAFAVLQSDDEVSHWPLIICGPMLRRVEEKLVCVFVATKLPCKLTLELFCAGTRVAGSGSTDTIALGPFLHVALVQFVPDQALSPGQLYSYDLAIVQQDEPTRLSTQAPELSYGGDGRPSFSLPPHDLALLNIVHGSCRREYGDGNDALPLVDAIFEGNWNDALKRPHQLLLTGDQIYADDVELTFSHTLQRLAKKLTVPRDGDGKWEAAYLEVLGDELLVIDDVDKIGPARCARASSSSRPASASTATSSPRRGTSSPPRGVLRDVPDDVLRRDLAHGRSRHVGGGAGRRAAAGRDAHAAAAGARLRLAHGESAQGAGQRAHLHHPR